jgi:hypothetical protein
MAFAGPEGSVFEDVSILSPGVIAVGNRAENGALKPYVVRYDRASETAEEVPVPALPGCTFSAAYSNAFDTAWLLLSDHAAAYYGVRAGIPVLYKEGGFSAFEQLGTVTGAYDTGTSNWVFYGLEYAGDNPVPGSLGPAYDGPAALYITDNLGASWFNESIPSAFGGRPVHSAVLLEAVRGKLFIGVRFADGAYGVVKRTGGVGQGEYELLFLSYQGPFFHELRAFAWRDDVHTIIEYGITCDAVGVGDMTSVKYDGGGWTEEALPYPLELVDISASYDSGFVAAGYDITYGGWALLYHP